DPSPSCTSTLSLHDALPILRLGLLADLRVERPRRVLLQLPLPRINLVRVHLIALGQVSYRRLLTQRFQRDFRFQRCIDLSSRLRSEEHTSELQSRSDLVCRL